MSTHFFGLLRALCAAALLAGASGCGGDAPPTTAEGGPQVRALRFAGVDLEYALERVAAEAKLPMVLDQITPQDNSPDLALYRVDVDLPAGSAEQVLRALEKSAGGFDFQILDGVIYARSQLSLEKKTPLDLPVMKAQKFKGTLGDLTKLVLFQVPGSYVTEERVMGRPAAPVVEFEIAENSSVRDMLVQYARASKANVALARAGHVVQDPTVGAAVVGTRIEFRPPRLDTRRLPVLYDTNSTVAAIANTSARLKAPIVVFDRSVMMNTRGSMNLSQQMDPMLGLKETLDDLAASGWGPEAWHFKWHDADGVPVVESARYLYFLRGRDLMRSELLAGEFEGSLPELARWINTHQKRSAGVLMGGELVDGMPRAKLTIAPGTTVEQALIAFAKASGVSPAVAVLDMNHPVTGELVLHPNAWVGAYLQDLAEWAPEPPVRQDVSSR